MNTLVERIRVGLYGPDGQQTPVLARLTWRPGDPWVVEATFLRSTRPEQDVVWLLGRDLLWDGLDAWVGDGDVEVGPGEDDRQVELLLSSPGGHAGFVLDAQPLAEFLCATYQEIPAGQELLWTPMDDELAELMKENDQ